MNKKLNCWEFYKCGREAGGIHVEKLGECIVSLNKEYDTINHGRRGGRICWSIYGSLCQDQLEEKCTRHDNCLKCEFLNRVRGEEKNNFILIKPHK